MVLCVAQTRRLKWSCPDHIKFGILFSGVPMIAFEARVATVSGLQVERVATAFAAPLATTISPTSAVPYSAPAPVPVMEHVAPAPFVTNETAPVIEDIAPGPVVMEMTMMQRFCEERDAMGRRLMQNIFSAGLPMSARGFQVLFHELAAEHGFTESCKEEDPTCLSKFANLERSHQSPSWTQLPPSRRPSNSCTRCHKRR